MRRNLLSSTVLGAVACLALALSHIVQRSDARDASDAAASPCRVSPDAESTNSAQQFFRAVLTKDTETVQEALVTGFNPDERDAYGNTALHWAAASNNAQIVELLVSCGADLEVRAPLSGATPLVLAVDHEAVDAVKPLLTAGANASVQTAAREGNKEVRRSAVDLAAQRNRLVLRPKSFSA